MKYKTDKTGTSLGRMIRVTRKTQGMSQMKLAEKLGVSYQQVQKYENGSSRITVTRLAQIASALGLSAHDLLSAEPAIADNPRSLSEKEARLLMLFRRLQTEKMRDTFIGMLDDLVKITPSK